MLTKIERKLRKILAIAKIHDSFYVDKKNLSLSNKMASIAIINRDDYPIVVALIDVSKLSNAGYEYVMSMSSEATEVNVHFTQKTVKLDDVAFMLHYTLDKIIDDDVTKSFYASYMSKHKQYMNDNDIAIDALCKFVEVNSIDRQRYRNEDCVNKA